CFLELQVYFNFTEIMPRAKADADKPRGRMSAYAFFVQTCREEHKKKHPNENVVFSEFSKKCAERWKTMNEKEKGRFHEMAARDKQRFDSEMSNYKSTGKGAGGRKRKRAKDPAAPKRALSAFFWFCADERPKVRALNPDYAVGDVAKELGKRWADATPEVKSKYEAMAAKDKGRYEREMTAYRKKPKANSANEEGGDDDDEEEEEEDYDDDEGDE
ncbi:unnamed protein product, partial [Darwinula stevensoni]